MITVNELKSTVYSEEHVSGQVTLDDLFEK